MERGGAYYSESAAALMADITPTPAPCRSSTSATTARSPACPTTSWSRCPRASAASGATALPTAPLRADFDALVRSAKDYELLTIEAALRGDQQLAELALITNPLGPDASLAPRVWERLRSDNEGLLGALDV